MNPPESDADGETTPRRDLEDALLADVTAPPALEQARESYEYWDHRLATLPAHKRAARREAEQMAARWKERLAAAERERNGPGLLEQLLNVLGVRRPPSLPSRRKIVRGLTLAVLLMVVVVVALLTAIVVFWSDLQPIVQTLLGNGNGNGRGGEG